MRNLKKVLALVIAFSMMLSVVAFAGYNDVDADADYAGAVELLSALSIIKGDDQGNFNPDNTITRAEMAAIVCRAKGLENAANGAKGATSFTDVAADHWAAGYINLATQNGIINGYGDGKFGPEDTVTYEQAVAMLVRALGFEPMAVNKGGFPTGYLVVANTYKITDGVAASVEAPRKTVAQLTYNALSTPMMDQTTYGADAEYEILDGKKDREYRTLLTDMDIYVATGIVGEKNVDEIEFKVTEDSDDEEFEKSDEAISFEINGTDIADYRFQNVDVYVQKNKKNDYKVLAVVPGVIGEAFALLSDDVYDLKEVLDNDDDLVRYDLEYYVDAANSSKTKTIKVAANVDTVYNKGAANKTLAQLVALDDVEIVLIENTGDTTYDVAIATEYYSAMVGEVNASRDRITIAGSTVSFNFEDEEIDIILCDVDGNELTLEDFAKDDVVAILSDASTPSNFKNFKEYIKIIKLADSSVTGIVEETYDSNDVDYVVIDGEEYVDATEDGLAVGDEGIFYIGMTGKIIVFDGSSVGVNYAYLVEAAMSSSSFKADRWQIKILTKDAGVVTYDVTDDVNAEFTEYALDAEWIEEITNADDEVVGYTDWLWADAASNDDAARLITFKTNAKGQIKSFEAVDADGINVLDDVNGEYRADTQKLDGNVLEDDIVLFVVTDEDADDVYATDISYLADEGIYGGYVFENDDKECVAAVITSGDSDFDLSTGFAIVTKKSASKNADENEIVKINYVQNEEEGTIVIDEDSTVVGSLDVDDLGIGDVIIFNADADGLVSKYAVVAQIVDVVDDDDNVLYQTIDIVNKEIVTSAKDEAGIVLGYISTRTTKSSGDVLEVVVDDETIDYVVRPGANKYTYNDAGRNVAIEIGDYFTEDVDVEVDGVVSFVLIRTFDDEVVDIYSANDRVELD